LEREQIRREPAVTCKDYMIAKSLCKGNRVRC